jgi:hypothetical protein
MINFVYDESHDKDYLTKNLPNRLPSNFQPDLLETHEHKILDARFHLTRLSEKK